MNTISNINTHPFVTGSHVSALVTVRLPEVSVHNILTSKVARREGKYYEIMGCASLDIIKSGGYKISALNIEREIHALPHISEAMVVGVANGSLANELLRSSPCKMKS